jgi:hypothetical protein
MQTKTPHLAEVGATAHAVPGHMPKHFVAAAAALPVIAALRWHNAADAPVATSARLNAMRRSPQ